MSIKYIAILSIVLVVSTAALTRYYFPQIQVKTVETTKDVIHTDIQTVTKQVTLPSGEIDLTTVTTDHSQHVETGNKSTTVMVKPKLNVSGLVGVSIHDPGLPIYGISASKEVLGPITVGVFGLTNGLVGVSIGFNF